MKKIKHLLISFLILFFCVIPTVDATITSEYKGSSGKKFYYSDTYSYLYKKIGTRTAYCVQLLKRVPSKEHNYNTGKWTRYSEDSFVAAQIIKRIQAKKFADDKEYMYIQYALNCYRGDYFKKYITAGRYTGMCSNSVIDEVKKASTNDVSKNYKFIKGKSTQKLPKLYLNKTNASKSLTATKTKGMYVSKKLTLSGMVKKYGSAAYGTTTLATYKLKATVTADDSTITNEKAYICPSATYDANNCKEEVSISGVTSKEYYVIVRNGGIKGGEVHLTITGNNKSTYPATYLWKPNTDANDKENLKYQKMITTAPSVTINRERTAELDLHYTAEKTYKASLTKYDESGKKLSGAELELYTASDANGTKDTKNLCNIKDGSKSCSEKNLTATNDKGYTNGRYICYKETKTPDGYQKIKEPVCEIIKLGTTDEYYYVGDEDVEFEEYDKYDKSTSYCVTATEDIIDETYINESIQNNTNLSEGTCQTTTQLYQKNICLYENSNQKTLVDDKYCAVPKPSLTAFSATNGSYNISVSNTLNSVNISKKSITDKEEVVGAELAIYKTNASGSCTNELATAHGFSYVDNTLNNEVEDNEENDSTDSGSDNGSSDSSSDSGDSGSSDSSSDSGDSGTEEEANDTYDPATEGLKWTSTYSPAIITGLKAATYCLVEEVAPKGYKKVSSTVKFSIDAEGNTKLVDNGGKNVSDLTTEDETSTITIYNEPTELSISKTDIATGKELPGATLSICEAVEENGKYEMVLGNNEECTIVSLADGTEATWTSTNKPHTIKGLAAGTYYLVEQIAPTDYSTAESILFKVSENGKILDINNKEITNNKIIMKDEKIKEVKTGDLSVISIITICITGLVTGTICYRYSNKKYGLM